jgi:hypothetical protein
MRRVFLTSALLCLASVAAGGAMFKTMIGSEPVQLILPAGMCQIERSNPSDAAYLKAIESGLAGTNKLLAAFAECDQLSDWRGSKKMFLEYGYYQSPVGMLESVATSDMVAEVCRELRSQGEKMLDGLKDDLTQRTTRALKGLQVNELRSLGVVGEDSNACYSAALRNLQAESAPQKLQDMVFAVTVLKGKLLFLYVYASHTDDRTIPALLDRVRTTVAALAAANEN